MSLKVHTEPEKNQTRRRSTLSLMMMTTSLAFPPVRFWFIEVSNGCALMWAPSGPLKVIHGKQLAAQLQPSIQPVVAENASHTQQRREAQTTQKTTASA